MTTGQDGSAAPTLRDGSLPDNARREQFSLGFVRMVTAAAGCSIKSHETDYDGVDITITSSTDYDTWYCPEIELQVKCTGNQAKRHEQHLAWSLKRDRFTKLTHPKRYNQAFLAVLLVPTDLGSLLDMSEARFMSESRMYWQPASKLGAFPDTGAESTTVNLPRSNLFDVDTLKDIMERVGKGEVL